MTRRPMLIVLACAALLAGCKKQDMYTQGSSRTWDQNPFFANGTTMRHPPEGTVAREPFQTVAAAPATVTPDLLARGQNRFEIFCTPCHGRLGNGEGMIVQRGFPHPPSFIEGKLRTADAQVFYDAITNGYGAMYSFDTRVAPPDRWAIVAYIRALQRSQNTAIAALPGTDQTRLDSSQ